MKRRKWTSETKAQIVLSGLKGLSIAEVCNDFGISQSQYYVWRDQFLAQTSKAFETGKVSKKQMRLEGENRGGPHLLDSQAAKSSYSFDSCHAAFLFRVARPSEQE